jgi:dsDNA-specific endonuclease/ATPase MutS2
MLDFLSGMPNIPTIDLHGTSDVVTGIEQLEKELFSLYNQGNQYCRVIHGIGSGRLADVVHEVLKKNPLIIEWKEEESGGSDIIYLSSQ